MISELQAVRHFPPLNPETKTSMFEYTAHVDVRAARTPTTRPYTQKTPKTPGKTPGTPVHSTPESPEKAPPKTSVKTPGTLTETLTTPHTPVAEAVIVCVQQPTLQPDRQVALTHQHGCQGITVTCRLDVYAWEGLEGGAGGGREWLIEGLRG